MPAIRIRAHYDELQKISKAFSQNSSSIASVNRKIKSSQSTLQGGDWIGKGATAFFKEMDGEVNPSMKRLEKALGDAARITKQIAQIMKQAEDEASGCFHL